MKNTDTRFYVLGSFLALVFFGLVLFFTQDNQKDFQEEKTQTQTQTQEQTTYTENLLQDKQNIIVSSSSTKKMNTHVIIYTNKGTITVELAADKPLTTENFKKLVSAGYYDGIKFHRVIEGFMIQAGDPQSKDESLKNMWGTGGPGYTFKDELTGKETYERGTLAMANAGPNTNGSQFFIMTGEGVRLPPAYTVFGKVVSGIETALAIQAVPTDGSDKPLENVVITKMELQ